MNDIYNELLKSRKHLLLARNEIKDMKFKQHTEGKYNTEQQIECTIESIDCIIEYIKEVVEQ